MSIEKARVAPAAAPTKDIQPSAAYTQEQTTSIKEDHRAERVARRRADMPKKYRGIYDKAMQGRSLKSAVHAFCLECCGWQRKEVELCSSPECSLYLYRPYQETPWKARRPNKTPMQGYFARRESSNVHTGKQ